MVQTRVTLARPQLFCRSPCGHSRSVRIGPPDAPQKCYPKWASFEPCRFRRVLEGREVGNLLLTAQPKIDWRAHCGLLGLQRPSIARHTPAKCRARGTSYLLSLIDFDGSWPLALPA